MSKLNLGDSLILDTDIIVGGGEVKTGATFNGKPVYVQVKSFTTPSTDNTYTSYTHDIANIDKVVEYKGKIEAGGASIGTFIQLNQYRSTSDFTNCACWKTGFSCVVASAANILESRPAWIEIYYTKTTD